MVVLRVVDILPAYPLPDTPRNPERPDAEAPASLLAVGRARNPGRPRWSNSRETPFRGVAPAMRTCGVAREPARARQDPREAPGRVRR